MKKAESSLATGRRAFMRARNAVRKRDGTVIRP